MTERKLPILCRREGSTLRPLDAFAARAIEGLPVAKPIAVRVTSARSVPQHRLYFAMLDLVAENLDNETDSDGLHDWIKLRVGLKRPVLSKSGKLMCWRPDSIAFDKMTDQADFQRFFDKAVALIVGEIIPGLDKADLEREANAMLKGKAAA